MADKNTAFFNDKNRPVRGRERLTALLHHHQRRGVAWFFDLDGTMITAPAGENAIVAADRDLQKMLNRLSVQAGGAVAVITGRPRLFVDSLIPRRNFASGVEHGALLQENNQTDPWQRRSKASKAELDELRAVLERQISGIAGAQVEDHKEGTLTVEFTRAARPDDLADRLEDAIRRHLAQRAAAGTATPIDVLRATVPGNYVIELLPAGAGKAPAVDHLMATARFAGKIPVFCGDSKGDEAAMMRVRALGGIAIGVGPKAPACSDVHFADVAAMRAFIATVTSRPVPPAPPRR